MTCTGFAISETDPQAAEKSDNPKDHAAPWIDRDSPRAREGKYSLPLFDSPTNKPLTDGLQGWRNRDGDEFFRQQRQKADQSNTDTAQFFYKIMKKNAQDLHQVTRAFDVLSFNLNQPNILDLCMAPGGFLETAMEYDSRSYAVAFSLPQTQGSHQVFMPACPRLTLKLLDITMLAADMDVTCIPEDYPDVRNFPPRELPPGQMFDLVICDGQVLRTHARAEYRENREARRLTVTQLALGLGHLKTGGTMIVLLHKLEAWDTVRLLNQFNEFSSVRLFRPTKAHSKRSSFYMVATQINRRCLQAMTAIEEWKQMWKIATLGTDQDLMEALRTSEADVEDVLKKFGPDLISMGRRVGDIQAKALARAPFMRES
ncbi:hypothetical protein LTR66_001960 [Elasticomyces elasticus]|nr:hypothetical protein LTR66_001960 [Elasticomyces elasticus]KAK5010228.1 hypothetical protein LTR28_011130 [Elasticomyces elasticus]